MEIRVVKGQLIDSVLAEQIIDLDRKNMQSILDQSGIEFPYDNRRKVLQSDSTFIIAFDKQLVAGYLDYLRSWNNSDYIYIGSVQLEKTYRGTGLLLRLLDRFRALLAAEDFVGFETNVQKANTVAVKLCQRIGFKLEPKNNASWAARAGKELIIQSPIVTLIDRWRAREALRLQG
jgi:ribosomal protein S18 acetylase RimI-like enzyme